ncbi:MAG TPA: penicillin-binding protein 2, partial [Actinomycetota bacterium]|nr:penicillin-binding protein 2 [Actinomycetota bacterium]
APVELRGRIPLSYDVKEERWRVDFTRGLLWPGVPGAWNFSVASKWPRRASIVDRQGRKLATGPVAHRRYPFGSLAGTTVGHIGVVDGKELARLPGYYGLGDLMGESGLEAAFDRRLGGVPELSLRITGRHGKVVRTLGRSPGRKGRKVTTTLDMRVQAAAAAAYAGHVGGAVVLDPRTGDMLAVVSSSEIDPGNYVGVDGIAPFNRALSGLYPPGSAMKVVTASAGLAAGVVKPSTVLPGPESYKGVTNFESEHFSSITFYDAFVKSVNSVFAQVAERMGVKPMYVYAKRFGFDRKPAMPLEAATPSYPRPKDLGDLMWSAVGQGRDLATPLQMASIAATIANRGVRMEPRIWFGQPKRGRRVISPRIASEIGSMMRSVVLRGTGTAANLPGIPVAGKTGTAEIFYNGGIEDHAWFESFAPYGAPRMASALVVEYGGVGGEVAAPIARSLIERVLPLVR